MLFTNVYISAARRTPIGRLNGTLAPLTAADLGVIAANAVLDGIDREAIGGSVFGHVLQAGCGMNIARQIALRCELPQSTPAFSVNVVCGSGLQAVALAAREVHTGEANLMLCGGTESMSNAPYLDTNARRGRKYGDATLQDSILADGLTDPLLKIAMGETAERIVDKYGLTRLEQDEFAARSQQLATADFTREIVPVAEKRAELSSDEHRRISTVEKLGTLKPVFRPDGTVTAGNASGINDGAAALLVGTAAALKGQGSAPRARIVAAKLVGCDPELMGLGPVVAIRAVTNEAGWNLNEIPAVEINEAFAAQTLACIRDLGLDPDAVNQRGGAIALGHPVGASGARVLTTLLHVMEDAGHARGIASLCIGGGQGIALAIELV